MIHVKGVLGFTATADGGVEIVHVSHGKILELTGEEWRKIHDLLRQDAKVRALIQEAGESGNDVDGISWTP